MKKYTDSKKTGYLNEPTALYISSAHFTNVDPLQLIQEARKGISKAYLLKISEALSLTLTELSKILHISIRSIQRYANNKKMDIDISAKAIQLENLRRKGVDVFGTNDAFNNWLRTPIIALNQKTPIDYLNTPFGFEMIEQLLGKKKKGKL